MRPSNSAEVRQAFLDFFQEMGHEIVPSSPLPVLDNPTLLFTNAGMNQFVDTFLGKEERPYPRAASSQKCMRVQGKHNDLENVGPSPRHHTFFEMLGNFSFGDYFKEGAIRFAYTFLTQVCEIPIDKLWYTVHTEDDDAYDIWVNNIGVSEQRVLRMGDKTNFWMMGDVGPCGPTSEVHYDWGPEACTCGEPNCHVLLDNDCGRWLELWNLVFMQFDQAEDGTRTPLPKPGVDTGLGLERITSIIEGQPVNYDTDLFVPAMNKVQELLSDSEKERIVHETGYRVIADHGRAATFLVGDGVLPGNTSRGYVLRMIIRRAVRFGRSIGFTEPFLAEIAQVYIEQMGEIYPELKTHRDHIRHTITLEERRFARTLDGAMAHLDHILSELHHEHRKVIPGEVAFDLYATHGLPLEITRDVAQEEGFHVDEDGFILAKEAHAVASGAGAFGQYETIDNVYSKLLGELIDKGLLGNQGVDYDPYSGPRMDSQVIGIIQDGSRTDQAITGQEVEIVTVATPFYVEAGGEVSDTGRIITTNFETEIKIQDVQQPIPGLIVHIGRIMRGHLSDGSYVNLEVDDQRRWDIRRNHTATHILHKELRAKLGKHVTQQGSLVAPDRLRFDFSHHQAVDPVSLRQMERSINEAILENLPVAAEYMSRKEAIAAGAMALFGEKYGEVVRTIKIGDSPNPYSFELCGGLHVRASGDIGLFHFTSEEAVGAGLRRVEAVTGRYAQKYVMDRLLLLERLAINLNSPVSELENKIKIILEDNRSLNREVSRLHQTQARIEFEKLLQQMQEVNGVPLMVSQVRVPDMDGLREMADWFRDRVTSGVAVLGAVVNGKVLLVVAVTDDLVSSGIKAGDLIGNVAKIVGGGGGGRPTLAQAGGKDPDKLPEALSAVPEILTRNLRSKAD
jgi:alanyl-tRNA synthetase